MVVGMSKEYPLQWPDGMPRTDRPVADKFTTKLNGALANVKKSLALFAADSKHKVENIVISSNVTLGNLEPKDPGVAVYFSWNGMSTCIPVDRYAKVEANLQAIHRCIEAERVKLRHGGINLVQAAFRGYAALEAPSAKAPRKWYEVFGVAEDASNANIERAYKRLRGRFHTDNQDTGDRTKYDEVQQAWSEYRDL
jgi:hypothetical protein